ncbi:MAG: hypothetical protein A2W52_03940 [Candidatus Taylorbacteria bacterium RIFCSPHIGHO2_02_49_25]|uniref:Uncharacterized protein n=1 Tax=Candidatus Taylorbacteria bacterium RIFCSPHIGHO2_02_49_25 TaxID=1802305 RepID=A0A1G2MGH8_9BACT|nr:MAG: hypothetical protein A2759_02820 [Candidatus Taylorbacteria bacterium RIFCSPHIGHO2_01_FULL_49_60]OHA22141.1 MAG: hypothetical protein A2W52_03940 [Candidatus Taylorbacteria bacterium RIFCSPHIGHO2_02_49_25]OHA37134.1 MAG: hypothetical protein A3B27_00845 [Candidatus Taylorbacteria bacterium RIFCSPLOWO2_01_FULL_50_130]OHA40553.1 MAG: hypothetical protein A3H73_01335 [Candidatus Taylorbacteria bacterium RIFCSPLOWO2_02_FULL_50_120]OHA46844.1 MAG: hypothetical protein A3G61_03780 [Candidatus
MSTGENHPPPRIPGNITVARISMLIRDVASISFVLGDPGEQKVPPSYLDQIRGEILKIYGREIPPLPPRNPDGKKAWKPGSLATYIKNRLNPQAV